MVGNRFPSPAKLLSKDSWIDDRPVALLPPTSSSKGSTAKRIAEEGRLTYAGRGASPEIAFHRQTIEIIIGDIQANAHIHTFMR